jgi:hypothetical protein
MTTDWAVLFATFFGPIFAVWASDWREERRRKRQRREDIVFALMSTRATIQAPEHVQALNRIEVAFPERKYSAVIDAWRQYHRHLFDKEWAQRDLNAWDARRRDLLSALIDQCARACSFEFPMDSIRNAAYVPSGWTSEAAQNQELRQHFLSLFRGLAAQAQAQIPAQAQADARPAAAEEAAAPLRAN